LVSIGVHVEAVEAAIAAIVTGASIDEDSPVVLRHRDGDLVPVRVKQAAQYDIDLSRTESRDDGLDVSGDPSGVVAPELVIIAALKNDDLHALRHIAIQPSQHVFEGVSGDASVPDLNVVSGRP